MKRQTARRIPPVPDAPRFTPSDPAELKSVFRLAATRPFPHTPVPCPRFFPGNPPAGRPLLPPSEALPLLP